MFLMFFSEEYPLSNLVGMEEFDRIRRASRHQGGWGEFIEGMSDLVVADRKLRMHSAERFVALGERLFALADVYDLSKSRLFNLKDVADEIDRSGGILIVPLVDSDDLEWIVSNLPD